MCVNINIHNLQDPAKRHLFVCLLNACRGDICSFTLTKPSREKPVNYVFDIGYESGPRFQVQGHYGHASKSEVNDALEAHGEVSVNPDGLIEYHDPFGEVTSVTRATSAASIGWIPSRINSAPTCCVCVLQVRLHRTRLISDV